MVPCPAGPPRVKARTVPLDIQTSWIDYVDAIGVAHRRGSGREDPTFKRLYAHARLQLAVHGVDLGRTRWCGHYGCVSPLDHDRVIKITGDPTDAAALAVIRTAKGRRPTALPRVACVFAFSGGAPRLYGAVIERLSPYRAGKEAQSILDNEVHSALWYFGVGAYSRGDIEILLGECVERVGEGFARGVVLPLFRAAEWLRARGIALADVHGGNVMLRDDGTIAISDLGGAHATAPVLVPVLGDDEGVVERLHVAFDEWEPPDAPGGVMPEQLPAIEGARDLPWLTPAEIRPWIPLMEREGVSEVARSPRGFLARYLAVRGRPDRLGAVPAETPNARAGQRWEERRADFVARHMAQARANREPLWRADGTPTRRHLGLIAWAYSPDPERLSLAARGGEQLPADNVDDDVDDIVRRVRGALTPDLLHPKYRACGERGATAGHCYVAAEAVYHARGGRASGLQPLSVRHEGTVRWWLRDAAGRDIDPTGDQFMSPPPYAQGVRRGFLTTQPSARARELLRRLLQDDEEPTQKAPVEPPDYRETFPSGGG